MPRRTLLLCLLTLLLLNLSQRVSAAEVPFVFRDGLVWLKVAVPGRAAPLNFLLDSGASATVVDLRAARDLGMKSRGTVVVQGVNARSVAYEWDDFSATVGGLPLPRKVLALDLGHISAACHQRIDGLVGADFFRQRVLELDYERRRLRMFARQSAPVPSGRELPLAIRNDAMCVSVAVDGSASRWTRVDTGCDSALHWVATPGRRIGGRGTSIAATTGAGRAVPTTVQIGEERVAPVATTLHARAIFSGEAGLVGNGLLSKFIVTFDRDGKRLFLDRR